MPSACEELNAQNLLQGYVELQSYGLAHLKSSALTCATGLGIPGAIARHRGGATISEIMVETGLHQSKLPYLRRLLHVLTVTGVFAGSSPVDDSETTYKLTPMSSLLVPDTDYSTTCDMSALLHILTRPTTTVSTFFNLEAWFREDGAMTPFEVAHGMSPWSLTKKDASYNDVMNHASVADTNFIMSIVLKEAAGRDIFDGLSSIIDVAGGHGAAAVAIARAFPHMKCSVLDLEQVINKAPTNGTVQYIVGDMFKYIPRADAVLLKVRFSIITTTIYVLHSVQPVYCLFWNNFTHRFS